MSLEWKIWSFTHPPYLTQLFLTSATRYIYQYAVIRYIYHGMPSSGISIKNIIFQKRKGGTIWEGSYTTFHYWMHWPVYIFLGENRCLQYTVPKNVISASKNKNVAVGADATIYPKEKILLEGPSPVQSGLCGWCLYLIKFLIRNLVYKYPLHLTQPYSPSARRMGNVYNGSPPLVWLKFTTLGHSKYTVCTCSEYAQLNVHWNCRKRVKNSIKIYFVSPKWSEQRYTCMAN